MSKAEEGLWSQIEKDPELSALEWEREYRFGAYASGGTGKGLRDRLKDNGLKDWRFDFAVPDIHLAVEVEGGAWVHGRHTRGKGFAEDLRKYDAAMRLGWTVYRCDAKMVDEGQALDTIRALIFGA